MKKIITTLLACWISANVVAQNPIDIDLWPNGLPNSNGIDTTQPYDDSKQNFKPSIRVFLPEKSKANGMAVVILPGGAYSHLASTIATHSDPATRPDFQVLFYPVISMQPGVTHQGSHDNFLGKGNHKRQEKNYSSDQQVNRNTPRAWIALSDDDTVVQPSNGVNYYMELYKHDIPASLHVYPDGGHGWGSRLGFKYHIEMIMELKSWLDSF